MRRILPVILVISLSSLSGCTSQPPPDTDARVRHWIKALHEPALKDADGPVRCEAILALVKCGPAAKGAIGELTQSQRKDRDARVRDFAARALEKINER